jgi:hypothetical protein
MARIADFRLIPLGGTDYGWTSQGVATPLLQSTIGNQQSAMKT